MPPPRASRLQSRKSVHADPSLYAAQSDTSSPARDDGGPPSTPNSSSPGKRKSARLSGEQPEISLAKAQAVNGSSKKRKSEKSADEPVVSAKKGRKQQQPVPVADAPPVPKFKPRAAISKKGNDTKKGGKKADESSLMSIDDSVATTTSSTVPQKRAAQSSLSVAGPSSSRKVPKGTPTRSADSTAAILHPSLETPTILSNILFRAGTEQTPGPQSTRRASLDRRGKRGSSIGGGFEALPHPQVPNDQLYKSTSATDPPARRLRSIISWVAQRQLDSLDRSSKKGKGKETSSAGDDATLEWAKQVAKDWISDVQQLKVDVSTRSQPSSNQSHLQPHPQNVANAQRYAEVQRNYQAIAAEEETRAEILAKYARLDSSRKALPTPSASRARLEVDSSTLDFDTGVPSQPADKELDMYSVRQIANQLASTRRANAKGKSRASLARSANREDVDLDQAISNLSIDTSELRTLVHRQAEFTELASRFVASRNKAIYDLYEADDEPVDGRDLLRAISRADAGPSSSPVASTAARAATGPSSTGKAKSSAGSRKR